MAQAADIPGWIAFFIGLYALAAGVGELREPGGWRHMLGELEQGRALRFLLGLFCIALGAAIYLVNPWRSEDWLAILISVVGGLCAVEGALILAAGDRFLGFARRLLAKSGGAWAWLSIALGFAMLAAGLSRIA